MHRSGLLILCLVAAANAAGWSYSGNTGPSYWANLGGNVCGGSSQSPIDIETQEAEFDNTLGTFSFSADYSAVPTGDWKLKNNGHSATATPESGTYTLTGGSLPGTFSLAQFHFHWGSVNTQGSEHTVNGEEYPLELHFVHFNQKYTDLTTAVDKADGLAVLGFFFQVGSENAALKTLTDRLANIPNTNDEITDLSPMNLATLMGGLSDLDDFWRYPGSLTTPPCYESVTWTVFRNILEVSEAQLQAFRTILDSSSNAIQDNYRPPLALNGRKVKASTVAGTSGATLNAVNLVCFSLLLFVSKIFS